MPANETDVMSYFHTLVVEIGARLIAPMLQRKSLINILARDLLSF